MDEGNPTEAEKDAPIAGIPCAIASRPIRDALRIVFAAIQKHPSDRARLRRRVIGVAYHPEDDGETAGEFILDADDIRALYETDETIRLSGCLGREEYFVRGWLALSRDLTAQLPREHLLAVIAHEAGHAVTRARDVEARERVTSDAEWASEMSADRYAFRWGFEREVRAFAAFRRVGHHGGLPGDLLCSDGRAFRVDARFFLRRAPRHDDEPGQLAETINPAGSIPGANGSQLEGTTMPKP